MISSFNRIKGIVLLRSVSSSFTRIKIIALLKLLSMSSETKREYSEKIQLPSVDFCISRIYIGDRWFKQGIYIALILREPINRDIDKEVGQRKTVFGRSNTDSKHDQKVCFVDYAPYNIRIIWRNFINEDNWLFEYILEFMSKNSKRNVPAFRFNDSFRG